jgi:porphobilinogen synthase
MSKFPEYRMRRLRRTPELRRMIRETEVEPGDLILPLFAVPGAGVRRPVGSMPGVAQTSVDELVRDAAEAYELGIPAVLLFGVPESKDELGSSGYAEDGIVQQAVRALKRELPQLVVITDVCLCEYTSHGHCGLIRGESVENDATLDLLARQALSHARAGADIVAPSDMMDGRVGAIRRALDAEGFTEMPILSYAAKFASTFYGPFRDAAESTPQFGDRRSYQMDPANAEEALREVRLDVDEGADILMVKPALPYLDILHRVREETGYPVFAYQVSGEYAAIMAAGEKGWLDAPAALRESLVAIKRAGATMIITYWAREFARGGAGR